MEKGKDTMKEYKVDLWQEKAMRYGTGLERMHDAFWAMDKLKETCCNAKVLDALKGINAINVIKRLDGTFCVNQISGYTISTGLYGYLVKPDNSLERFC